MKETKGDTNRWINILCFWIGRINIVKMNILLKSTYRFHAIPIKLPIAFFIELEQKCLQFVWKHSRWGFKESYMTEWLTELNWLMETKKTLNILWKKYRAEVSDSMTSNYTAKLE